MVNTAILLAGGSGTRMKGSTDDKILIKIAGKPVFKHVLDAFQKSAAVSHLVVVCRDDTQRKTLKRMVDASRFNESTLFTIGGRERRDSVANGLEMLHNDCRFVYIHDCARPAVSPTDIKAVEASLLRGHKAAALAHKVVDTHRYFENDPSIKPETGKLISRDNLWAMETPQAFEKELIEEAYSKVHIKVTDDVACVEQLGIPVSLIQSSSPNPKLTRPTDLFILESLLLKQTDTPMELKIRVGSGYDIHRLKEGRKLFLGSIEIPSKVGLEGHSDADVLIHAIADAILGAAGLKDIGFYFPNTDPSIKGIPSSEILRKVVKEAENLGYQVGNIDSSLIAEKPKIAPYIDKMKASIAQILKISPNAVGIKATTNEKLGALGAGEGIAAHATALLVPKN